MIRVLFLALFSVPVMAYSYSAGNCNTAAPMTGGSGPTDATEGFGLDVPTGFIPGEQLTFTLTQNAAQSIPSEWARVGSNNSNIVPQTIN